MHGRRCAVRGRALDELRRLSPGTLDPQWIEPLHGLSAQLALLEERHGDARDAVAQGLAAIDGIEDGAAASCGCTGSA